MKDQLTPEQRTFYDENPVDVNTTKTMIARKMLRNVNDLLRFLNDFEPRTLRADMPETDQLTPEQRTFYDENPVDPNATQAMIAPKNVTES